MSVWESNVLQKSTAFLQPGLGYVLHGSDYARSDRRVAHATTSVRRGPQHRGSDP
jgi:hypothetical protein